MEYTGKWDRFSVGVSLVCAIHCIVLPIFITSMTILNIEIIENPVLEFLTIILSMFAGGWAVWNGFRKFHRQFWIVLVFLAGLLLMTMGNAFDEILQEQIFKVSGILTIVTAHFFNWKKSKQCVTCKGGQHSSHCH